MVRVKLYFAREAKEKRGLDKTYMCNVKVERGTLLMEETARKSIIHCEADIGSSIFNITTQDCDAVQLLGLAQVLHAHGMAALAADMSHASQSRSPIEVVRSMPKGN